MHTELRCTVSHTSNLLVVHPVSALAFPTAVLWSCYLCTSWLMLTFSERKRSAPSAVQIIQLAVRKTRAHGRIDTKFPALLMPHHPNPSEEWNQLQMTQTHRPAVRPPFAGTYFFTSCRLLNFTDRMSALFEGLISLVELPDIHATVHNLSLKQNSFVRRRCSCIVHFWLPHVMHVSLHICIIIIIIIIMCLSWS